ncbi:MAG: DUF2974 domain-containing protein [Spirochaetales bacterium]|nr:DUF2974 domain-containing protein [Spirochaetales bacterium]
MNNVFGYIDEQSDSVFRDRPFCEVDALIFAWLSYFEIEKLDNKGIECRDLTLENLVEKYEQNIGSFKKPDKREKLISVVTGAWMLKQVSDKTRFKDVRIGDFKTVTDHENCIQFSVTSYILETGVEVVSFRGTDTSVAGWKEDCMMTFSSSVPSQELALEYLNGREAGNPIVLAGHSKGGNLAIYSASGCRSDLVPLISDIYNFDGPGFCFDINASANFKDIKNRIHSYVPGSTVVGMLMKHMDDYAVVSSMNTGIMQHYAFYWKIEGQSFVLKKNRSMSSRSMDVAFNQWLDAFSFEERKALVETIFSIIEESGVKYFDDFSSSGFAEKRAVLSRMHNMDPQNKKMIRVFFGKLMRASQKEMISSAAGFFGKVKGSVVDKVHQVLPSRQHK